MTLCPAWQSCSSSTVYNSWQENDGCMRVSHGQNRSSESCFIWTVTVQMVTRNSISFQVIVCTHLQAARHDVQANTPNLRRGIGQHHQSFARRIVGGEQDQFSVRKALRLSDTIDTGCCRERPCSPYQRSFVMCIPRFAVALQSEIPSELGSALQM